MGLRTVIADCYTVTVELSPSLGVAVVLSAAALTGCSGPPGGTGSPEVDSVSAETSPEDVVRSYLGALQDDDESAAAALTTAPYSERDPWADDPPTIEDVEVSGAMSDPSGRAATGYVHSVYVPVTFTLHGADETMSDGPTAWGYRVVRNTDAEVWKIADAGM